MTKFEVKKCVANGFFKLLFALAVAVMLTACLHDDSKGVESQENSFKFYTLALFEGASNSEPTDIESIELELDIEDQIDAFDALIERVVMEDVQ